jgi:hypothetical protein
VSLTERLIAYLRRRADAQIDRANLAAMQHGMLPAGWVYGRNDKRQAQYDEQRRILLERSKHLYREPVYGPDGVAVAIWYAGTDEYRPRLSFIVQAHAMSGPPAAVIVRFWRKQDAASFAAGLAQQVRASGVAALRQDAWPDLAGQD